MDLLVKVLAIEKIIEFSLGILVLLLIAGFVAWQWFKMIAGREKK